MKLPTRAALEHALAVVREAMPPTPQLCWPQLSQRLGAEVWVKHENQTPLGAFKIRGGLVYFDALGRRAPHVRAVIAATRGNHGQSIAFAAQRHGLAAVIVVPRGNSPEKNAAMRARGVELIEHGADFQDAFEHAQSLAASRTLHLVPSFDEALVCGVATYCLELFAAVNDLHTLYVPVGMGSGICGAIAAREALGCRTEIVGVVASAAPAVARSFAAGTAVSAAVAPTIADGVAIRRPDAAALEIMLGAVARIVTVEEHEIRSAMRIAFMDTHTLAEGAGALALAAARQEQSRIQGRRIGLIQSGANVDAAVFAAVLAEAEHTQMQHTKPQLRPTSETG